MPKNNFDFLRLCFAFFVLLTHSYNLSGAGDDPLGNLTSGQVNFSSIGLKGFFTISGFLIFESLIRSKGWIDYMIKRVLRIYPALIGVLIVCFFLGMILSPEPASLYIHDTSALSYVYVNLSLFLPMKFTIPNVFPTNHVRDGLNGSLWTIPYEFLFYILLSALLLVRRYPKLISILLGGAFCVAFCLKIKYNRFEYLWMTPLPYEKKALIDFALLFIAGAFLASIGFQQFRYRRTMIAATIAASILFILLHRFSYAQFVLFPLMIISLGSLSTRGIAGLNGSMGDFSYGIYLYGFPVQQTLLRFFTLTPLQLLAAAAPITFAIAAISWFLIEKRALGWKRYLTPRPNSRLSNMAAVSGR